MLLHPEADVEAEERNEDGHHGDEELYEEDAVDFFDEANAVFLLHAVLKFALRVVSNRIVVTIVSVVVVDRGLLDRLLLNGRLLVLVGHRLIIALSLVGVSVRLLLLLVIVRLAGVHFLCNYN